MTLPVSPSVAAVLLRGRPWLLASELENWFAALKAPLKTDEKKPPAPALFEDDREADGVCPGVLLSSGMGVKGAVMLLDSLLGWCAESDPARRCETMLPDGEVTTFGFAVLLA